MVPARVSLSRRAEVIPRFIEERGQVQAGVHACRLGPRQDARDLNRSVYAPALSGHGCQTTKRLRLKGDQTGQIFGRLIQPLGCGCLFAEGHIRRSCRNLLQYRGRRLSEYRDGRLGLPRVDEGLRQSCSSNRGRVGLQRLSPSLDLDD